MLAAKYSLPFGRPMPSEGLSVDQMCQAVQAVGVAPNLFRVEDLNLTRAYLHTALRSGFAPVLILESHFGRHAVAVVGMKLKLQHEVTHVAQNIDDAAADLVGVYIHDDRWGPYLRAELATKDVNGRKLPQLVFRLRGEPNKPAPVENWTITHILVPMHSKIRLSFSGLRQVANEAVKAALRYPVAFQIPGEQIPDATVTLETWIVRAHKYVESLFIGTATPLADRISSLSTTISLARYLGIVRLSASYFDPIDLIVDTTSTRRNVHCLAVLIVKEATGHTSFMAQHLANVYGCPLVA
jgi:hypothetical protein